MLSSMGVEVLDERPYELDGLDRPTFVYEFGLRYPPGLPDDVRGLFQDAIRAVWDGYNEIDGFNALVLAAGLTWRQATVLRAYAKYMKQGNSPVRARLHRGRAARQHRHRPAAVAAVRGALRPGKSGLEADAEARTARVSEIEERIKRALDDVASLDHDRILRSYLTHIKATLRTNYFQHRAQRRLAPARRTCRFKLEPSAIPDLPEPRPRFEIFVYSPRVEGVHLRFGAVARGGLRWSDRRDDFRTEVLGLVKAQMVKNTVIVPVGAKGGFFCKQLPRRPAQPSDREAWLAEGVACYKTFISGLLDITDNLVEGETRAAGGRRPPRRRRLLPGGRRRQGHRDVLRHRQRRRQGLRLLARRRVRQRRLGRLRPQGDGHHRPRRLGVGAAPLPRARRRLPDRGLHRASASATCPATCSATACSAPSTPGWWRPSTTATSSSTRRRTPRRRTPSASGCSSCRAPSGRTTTRA